MKNNDNVLAQEIRIFRIGDEDRVPGLAVGEADRIVAAVYNRDYLDIPADRLFTFVRSAFRAMDELDFVDMYPGERIPSDAFTDLVLRPSYAVVALCVYLKVTLGEAETAWMDADLKRLMDAGFHYGIMGHGEDKPAVFESVMTALGRAGLGTYLSRGTVLSEDFRKTAESCYHHILEHGTAPEEYAFTPRHYFYVPDLTLAQAAFRGFCNPVFVYGTLMAGQPAANLLGDNAIFVGPAMLPDHAMYDLGSYPGIVPAEGEQVIGEVYLVDDEAMKRMDRYEGEGSLYLRQTVSVEVDTGWRLSAKAYIYARPVCGEPVRERWGIEEDDEVWYAAYGSNLSEERFRCYLEGGICPENGKDYPGCRDKRLWSASVVDEVPGRVYFARHSPSWNGGGVAFFDGERGGRTIIRRYRITWGQLQDIQKQEGPAWYGSRVFLGFREGACVYTLTSREVQKQTEPDAAYLELIRKALMVCGKTEKEVETYLKACQRRMN